METSIVDSTVSTAAAYDLAMTLVRWSIECDKHWTSYNMRVRTRSSRIPQVNKLQAERLNLKEIYDPISSSLLRTE